MQRIKWNKNRKILKPSPYNSKYVIDEVFFWFIFKSIKPYFQKFQRVFAKRGSPSTPYWNESIIGGFKYYQNKTLSSTTTI